MVLTLLFHTTVSARRGATRVAAMIDAVSALITLAIALLLATLFFYNDSPARSILTTRSRRALAAIVDTLLPGEALIGKPTSTLPGRPRCHREGYLRTLADAARASRIAAAARCVWHRRWNGRSHPLANLGAILRAHARGTREVADRARQLAN